MTTPASVHLDTAKHSMQQGMQWQQLEQMITHDMDKEMFAQARHVPQAWHHQLSGIVREMEQGNFSSDLVSRFLALGRDEGDMLVALIGVFKGLQVTQADEAYQVANKHYQLSVWVFALCLLLLRRRKLPRERVICRCVPSSRPRRCSKPHLLRKS